MLVELRERVERLEAENAELRRRLGLNSSNSSMPPSSDGLAKPRPQPGKGKSSGRRRGKQPGAPGSTLDLVADPDETVEHRPVRCVNPACGAGLADGREHGRQRRQVVELPEPRPVVTEHQLIAVECACCGQVTEPPVPDGVSGRVQYGTNVKAGVVYARAAQFLPYARVAALMGDLLGVRVSTGFVYQVVAEAARRLGPFTTHLAALLHTEAVLHADETPGAGRRWVQVRACGLHAVVDVVPRRWPVRGRRRRRWRAARFHRHPGPRRLRRLPAPDRRRAPSSPGFDGELVSWFSGVR